MRATLRLFKKFDFPPIPTRTQFTQYSKSLATLRKNRAFVYELSCGEYLENTLGPNLWKDKTIVELFPGPGVLTRSMIKLGAKGVIPLESSKIFVPDYQELEKVSEVPIFYEHADKRSDDTIKSLIFDSPVSERTKVPRVYHSWDEVHPSMIMTSISSSINEAYYLSFQLIRLIYERLGFFEYGRLPIVMIAPPEVLKGYIHNSMVGFLWRAVADFELSCTLQEEYFMPQKTMVAVKIIPYVKPKITVSLDTYYYVVSKLMVRKKQSLGGCLGSLGPGASAFKKNLNFDIRKLCCEMSMNEMNQVAHQYSEWYTNRYGHPPIHEDLI